MSRKFAGFISSPSVGESNLEGYIHKALQDPLSAWASNAIGDLFIAAYAGMKEKNVKVRQPDKANAPAYTIYAKDYSVSGTGPSGDSCLQILYNGRNHYLGVSAEASSNSESEGSSLGFDSESESSTAESDCNSDFKSAFASKEMSRNKRVMQYRNGRQPQEPSLYLKEVSVMVKSLEHSLHLRSNINPWSTSQVLERARRLHSFYDILTTSPAIGRMGASMQVVAGLNKGPWAVCHYHILL